MYAVMEDDSKVMSSTQILRERLEELHNRFDQTTDPALVDSIIYEIQAVQLRYIYHLNLCKKRGIVSSEFGILK